MKYVDLDQFSPWPNTSEEVEDLLQTILTVAQGCRDLTFTGTPPGWLCMLLGHYLSHHLASLYIECPDMGPVEVFDHNPF
ncbi:hypothetical protein [Desulfurispira natronophila]|uniref:Uncharacterized protein n=1 Tax=Desulfurispira natronophila TaxID=682562 RepID=A0A7W7Y539_9BACT|nr:hypothetical protein [Desulfurispira natronophila]MBB5022256.1 hypothetical protein [Desulfurispira natronophila]